MSRVIHTHRARYTDQIGTGPESRENQRMLTVCRRRLALTAGLLFGLLGGHGALAADLAREQRITEQIEDAILEGDPLYLNFGGRRFMGIYTRSDAERTRGAVILLHGRGANPDWQDVIQPLRTGLPEHGWDTLSIQLPVESADAPDRAWDALIPAAAPRIDAALQALAPREYPKFVLIGHSFGARMATEYLASRDPASLPQISALVAVGLPVDDSARTRGTLEALGKIDLPILDIYGERDLARVLEGAQDRRMTALDAKNTEYRQVEIADADHFFANQDTQLVARVRAWLSRYSD